MLEFVKNLIYKNLGIIGLDLGQSRAHFIEIQKTTEGFSLLNIDTITYADTFFQKGIVIEAKTLSILLQNALKICSNKLIAMHIADEFILTKRFNLNSSFNEEEQIAYVMLEAEKRLPYPLDDLYYDFVAVKEQQKTVEITLVACDKTICDSRLTLLKDLGYQPIFLGIMNYLLTDFKQQKTLLKDFVPEISLLKHTQSSLFDPKNFYLAMALAITGYQYVTF